MQRTGRDVRRPSTQWGFDVRTRSPLSELLAAALPGALLAAVVATDYLTNAPYYVFLAPLIVAVPALAAATSGLRGAVVFTALSVGANFLLADLDGRLYTRSFYGSLAGLAVIFAVSLLPGYLRTRRERQLALVRSVAETVQRAVLVPIPERIDCLSTSTAYVAADEEARIGGDLYEALATPYGVRIIIGDVLGKGLASVEAAANLLGAFREIAPHAIDLPALVGRLESSVQRHNGRAGLEIGDFVTAAILCVPPEPVMQMICCGHPAPLLLHGRAVRELRASRPSPPLGLGELNTAPYQVDQVDFVIGDRLLLYTDGVTEARNVYGAFYPLADRVAALADTEPEQLVKQVVDDLVGHTGGRLTDDAALMACQRLAPPA